jgi:hypothetical protein
VPAHYNVELCIFAENCSPKCQANNLNRYDLVKGKRSVGAWGGESQADRETYRYVDPVPAGGLTLIASSHTSTSGISGRCWWKVSIRRSMISKQVESAGPRWSRARG